VTRLRLRPYHPGDDPPAGSVPVSVVVLTLNEEPNIRRCLASVAWADQVVVVDAGSTDATAAIARSLAAEVVEQPWLGFSAQRDFALRLPLLRHHWVYFVDADEWVSPQLAAEIADRLRAPCAAAFAHRLRLVFQGRWIRHCGWYHGSWVVRLMDRRRTSFDGSLLGERARVDGPVLRLRNDIVDQDVKGLAAWLHKHVRYAQLEAQRRGQQAPLRLRIRALRADPAHSAPFLRSLLKDVVFPAVPAKPAAVFAYMYLLRLGLLDGLAGLRFCFYHAWFQVSVTSLRAESTSQRGGREGTRPRLGVLATHAIQYQAPLYQALSRRGEVELDVGFLSDAGARPRRDAGFGAAVAWNIDLLGGYRWTLLDHRSPLALARWPARLAGWLRRQDVVVLHGHADPRMLLAAAACRVLGVPYLLRGDSEARTRATGWRRLARHLAASCTVRCAAGALPVGQLNAGFYRRYGRLPLFAAPHSVDNDRFRDAADAARATRASRLASLGLDPRRPVVIFSGKLTPGKRPLDAVRAIGLCQQELSMLLLGDGPLRSQIGALETRLPVRCLGFVNQAELPAWYACGDVLVLPSEVEQWGLVVNEGMACGLVPVVSDAVGCAPDLVAGVGEIFAVGNVSSLARALITASRDAPRRRENIRRRLERFTLTETARGYERAALALRRQPGG
jgi:glycosyltransferase involved in cell wall biosynthesis